ncbi:MAG TPA: threonine/serine dehydratase [Blastocatellia bacterium]|nr:threonine/serine dehydratase [Blastocatellia bacterium]
MKESAVDIYAEATRAEGRIRPYLRETPLDYSLPLSQQTQAEVFLKLENLQYTGSFKTRGAMNKLLALTPEQQRRGIVTASTGNHGAAVAFGLRALSLPGVVFVPENASATKVEAIRRYGAEVRHYSTSPLETELYARRYAAENNLVYISPYNDPDVIAGQGTIGVELLRQCPAVDAVFIAVGGGGLAAGVAGYLKSALRRDLTIIGCLPENSPEMAVSVKAGHFVEMEPQPTLSDATAGGFEPGAITFDLCRALIDDYVLVSEAEIAATMREFIEAHHLLIEGSAGVALAGFLKLQERFRQKSVVIIICGANISLTTLKTIL